MYEKSNTYGTVVITTIRYVISEILLVDFAFFVQGARPHFRSAYM